MLTRNLIILAFVAGLLVTLGFGFYMAKGFQYRSNQQEWLQKIIYTGVGTNATTMEKLRLYKRNLHFQLWWCIAGVVYWGLFSIYQCSLLMKGMIKRDDVFRFHLVSEKELGLILRSILGIFLVIWTVMFAADLFVIWVELLSVTLLMRGDWNCFYPNFWSLLSPNKIRLIKDECST